MRNVSSGLSAKKETAVFYSRFRVIGYYVSGLFFYLNLVGSLMRYYKVCDNAEDECAGNGGKSDLAEVHGESADTADEYDRYNKEVSVFAEVNLL